MYSPLALPNKYYIVHYTLTARYVCFTTVVNKIRNNNIQLFDHIKAKTIRILSNSVNNTQYPQNNFGVQKANTDTKTKPFLMFQ